MTKINLLHTYSVTKRYAHSSGPNSIDIPYFEKLVETYLSVVFSLIQIVETADPQNNKTIHKCLCAEVTAAMWYVALNYTPVYENTPIQIY